MTEIQNSRIPTPKGYKGQKSEWAKSQISKVEHQMVKWTKRQTIKYSNFKRPNDQKKSRIPKRRMIKRYNPKWMN